MALIISLIFLMVLTLIGVSGMQNTALEEKMAGNLRDRSLAFQAAEAALDDAEQFVEGLVTTGAFDGSGGLLGTNDPEPPDLFAASSWTDARAYSGTLPGVASQPAYLAKKLTVVEGGQGTLNIKRYGKRSSGGDVTMFRITVRGTGGTDQAQVILRSHYGKIF